MMNATISEKFPVVDLSQPNAGKAFSDAAHQWGFLQIVNHGISAERLAKTWEQTRAFFEMSSEQKRKLLRSADNAYGYFDQELTKNRRDLKEILDFGPVARPDLPDDAPENRASVDGFNQWPAELPAFKLAMMEYFSACETLGRTLLSYLCEGMSIASDTLAPHFGANHTGFMRLNYYPTDDPLSSEDAEGVTPLGDMALHHHTDAGVLTVLLQDDVGGLQACHEGNWIDLTPVEDALVINVGDMMQVWSNDYYPAGMHRVLPCEGRSRYSIPFFFNPAYETTCAPLTSDDPKYRPINWGEFRKARSDGDYANVGKEIQITDYLID